MGEVTKMAEIDMTKIVEGEEALKEFERRKCKDFYEIKYPMSQKAIAVASFPDYTIFEENKRNVYLRKNKNKGNRLEDRVWCLFYKMGFLKFNGSTKLDIPYSDEPGCQKQIDVFCVDDETAIIVECKNGYEAASLKENVESYIAHTEKMIKYIKSAFGKHLKVGFVYVTEGYSWTDVDTNRLNQIKISHAHFDEKTLANYEDLVDQLKESAKYQFLGFLFKDITIKGFDNDVLAIEGEMGGHKYYSFLIKPSHMLKMAYVLHRNNANSLKEMMPSYQRVIKKDRLNKIRAFIDEGGHFFPNAIIVSIRTKNEKEKFLSFEPSSTKLEGSKSRIGILHLPKTYQSAYVIDGQHRLYGYSGTKYEDSNYIPVVAFPNLEKEEQLEMFMQINQNQKQIPTVLKDTLQADMLYVSNDYGSVELSIKKRIAMMLGESGESVIRGFVLTGENKSSDATPLTIKGIYDALCQTQFFDSYNDRKDRKKVTTKGWFDFGIDDESNDSKHQTEKLVFDIINGVLKRLKKDLNNNWNNKDGFLITNNIIQAIICLLGEFVEFAYSDGRLSENCPSANDVLKAIDDDLTYLSFAASEFNEETNNEFRSFKGAGALTDSWHALGYLIYQNSNESFNPSWMSEYIDNFKQNNAAQSKIYLDKMLEHARELVRQEYKILNKDFETSISNKLLSELTVRRATKKAEELAANRTFDGDLISVASFSDIHTIIHTAPNWSQFGKKLFGNTKVDELFKKYDNSADLMEILGKFYKKVSNGTSLSKKDFADLQIYQDEFLKKNVESAVEE